MNDGPASTIAEMPEGEERQEVSSSSSYIFKCVLLCALVLQTAAHSMTVYYAKTRPNSQPFLQASVVTCGEVIKLLFSTAAAFITAKSCDEALSDLRRHLSSLTELTKVGGVSLLYTIQGNLTFIAMSNLNPSVFQIVQQTKLLFTALFAAWIMNQKFTRKQKVSLFFLAVGVSMMQLVSNGEFAAERDKPINTLLGFFAAMGTCVLSGFCGVYLEKVLKTTSGSVWIRNIQLSSTAVPLGIFLTLVENRVKRLNFIFDGYDSVVFAIVVLFAMGGILVAAAIKHSDNIMKSFATSLAIVLTAVFSCVLFDFHANAWFAFGTLSVLLALALYVT